MIYVIEDKNIKVRSKNEKIRLPIELKEKYHIKRSFRRTEHRFKR